MTSPLTETIIQIDKDVLRGWSVNDTRYDQIYSVLSKNSSFYLFAESQYSDFHIGVILLVGSIAVLALCLVILVKLLDKILKTELAKINFSDSLPDFCLSGYLSIIIGGIVTFLVQSSSVFTSTLIPLVGGGFLSLEQAYPLTLGSNIGTTTTGILAALASRPEQLSKSMQIALCHLYLNLTGVLLFYPFPFMRFPVPLGMLNVY